MLRIVTGEKKDRVDMLMYTSPSPLSIVIIWQVNAKKYDVQKSSLFMDGYNYSVKPKHYHYTVNHCWKISLNDKGNETY